MTEPLTSGEKKIVFDDIQREIKRLDALIKERKVFGATLQVVDEKRTLLQKHLDKILKKGGIITEEDYNETYNIIKAKEEKELIDLKNKAKRNLTTIIIFGVGVIVAYILLVKKNTNE